MEWLWRYPDDPHEWTDEDYWYMLWIVSFQSNHDGLWYIAPWDMDFSEKRLTL